MQNVSVGKVLNSLAEKVLSMTDLQTALSLMNTLLAEIYLLICTQYVAYQFPDQADVI